LPELIFTFFALLMLFPGSVFAQENEILSCRQWLISVASTTSVLPLKTYQSMFEDTLGPTALPRLAPTPILPYRTQKVVESLRRGDVQSEIIIVTHQDGLELQDRTAVTIAKEPSLKSVPRIILANEDYKVASPLMLNQATLVLPSQGGEMEDLPVKARKAHLVGGYCGSCLTTTATELMKEFRASDREELTLVVHLNLIYFKHRSSGPNFTLLDGLKGETGEATYRPNRLFRQSDGSIRIENYRDSKPVFPLPPFIGDFQNNPQALRALRDLLGELTNTAIEDVEKQSTTDGSLRYVLREPVMYDGRLLKPVNVEIAIP
jgi:hypothetical protein